MKLILEPSDAIFIDWSTTVCTTMHEDTKATCKKVFEEYDGEGKLEVEVEQEDITNLWSLMDAMCEPIYAKYGLKVIPEATNLMNFFYDLM